MGILWEIAASLGTWPVILGGLGGGAILLTQKWIWAYRILAAFVLWDCVILASHWPDKIVRTPTSFPAPEVMGQLEQADVTRAGLQLAGAILIMAAIQLARVVTGRRQAR